VHTAGQRLQWLVSRRLIAILAAVLFTACAGSRASVHPVMTADLHCCEQSGPVTFTYLGTGGWLIRHGGDAMLTAPFFTNTSIWALPFPLRSNTALVKSELPSLDDVKVILAGHSHYDHLLDMPAVLQAAKNATLYGDTTMTHALAPTGAPIVSLVAIAGDERAVGEWTKVGNIRFLAIRSEHAAHVLHVKFLNGHYVAPLPRLPRHAWEWREGEPLAFLIDFLENGRTIFRIYYDDAAHNSPYGIPDDATLGEHQVDAAIICAASFEQVADYPQALLAKLKPKHVLLGHWEDFFTSYKRPARPVRLTDVAKLYAQLSSYQPLLPDRKATITFKGK